MHRQCTLFRAALARIAIIRASWTRVAGKTFLVSWQRAAAAFRLASSAGSRSAQQIEVDSASNLEAHFTWSDHHGQYWQEMCSKAFVWPRAFNALRNNIESRG
jgi:hypothetical protein